jgi:hypothetical protein
VGEVAAGAAGIFAVAAADAQSRLLRRGRAQAGERWAFEEMQEDCMAELLRNWRG